MDVPPILTSRPPTPPTPTGKQKRHGCLTTWLAVMLLYYAIMTLGNLAEGAGSSLLQNKTGKTVPTEAPWVTISATTLYGLGLLLTVFVFLRKKWAFMGVVFASVATMA